MDHVGGLRSLFRRFRVKRVIMAKAFAQDPVMRQVLGESGVSRETVIFVSGRQRVRFGSTELRIDAMDEALGGKDNDGSLFVRVTMGTGRALLTGDASTAEEEVMLARGDWQAEVLKAGHHGSRTSTGGHLLAEVRPRWVVFTVGRRNNYGHPTAEALARATSAGAMIARTDLEGTVEFKPGVNGFVKTPSSTRKSFVAPLSWQAEP